MTSSWDYENSETTKMKDHTTTIKEAIEKGLKTHAISKRVLPTTAIVGIGLPLLSFSWSTLLVIPIGIIASTLFDMWTIPRWKLWAYEHISDIHQLQRSAELAGVLSRHSYNKTGLLLNKVQKRKLKLLQERFEQDADFCDDTSYAAEYKIYSYSSTAPLLILNKEGIQVEDEYFAKWEEVHNERIAHVSYSKMSPRTGGDISAGSKDFLRFECSKGRYEHPISALNLPAWEIDLLLYIYRNRGINSGSTE